MSENKKEDIVDVIRQKWKYVSDKYSTFIDRAKTDLDYYRGEQWESSVRRQREAAGRPVLTKNRIKPKTNLMLGVQRNSRYYFKVVANDEADIEYSAVAQRISEMLKEIENENDGEYELSDCFFDGIATGRGYLQAYIEKDQTKLPERYNIKFRQREYNRIFVDPDSRNYDLSDAGYYFVVEKFDEDKLIEMFPDKEKEIKALPAQDPSESLIIDDEGDNGVEPRDYPTQNDKGFSDVDATGSEPKILTLKEYYYYKLVKKKMLVTTEGEFIDVTDRDDEDVINEQEVYIQAGIMNEDTGEVVQASADYQYRIVDQHVKQWRVCSYCHGAKLDEQELNIDEPDIAPYFADFIKSTADMEKRARGVISDLRSPQDEYNMLASQTLALLNSNINGGTLYEEGAINKSDIPKWKKFGSSPGFMGKINNGYMGKVERITPAPLSSGHFTLAKDSAAEMDEISNIRPDLMGANSGDKSGRALALQQQQGFLGIGFYFDNFRRTKHLLARKLVKLICYVNDWDFEKLKLEIDDAAESPTQRYVNFLESKELYESGALDSPYGDLIIESMNLNNKDKYKERWEKMIGQKLMASPQGGISGVVPQQQGQLDAVRQAAEQDAAREMGLG